MSLFSSFTKKQNATEENKINTKKAPPRFGYIKASRSPLYACINACILLCLYEAILNVSELGSPHVRNLSDLWFRTILLAFHISYHTSFFIFFGICFCLGLFFFIKTRQPVSIYYLSFILMEACVWAWLIYMFSSISHYFPLSLQTNKFTSIGLAIGAGLFEELLFRVLLMQGLVKINTYFIKSLTINYVLAVTISAFLFSASHHIGNGAYIFTWHSFFFRFLAGLFFSGLYSVRGFSVTAYTHMWYDIFVILTT